MAEAPSPALEALLATPYNPDDPLYQARLTAALAEMTPAAPAPAPVAGTVEEIAARVRTKVERRQLIATLDAELARVPEQSAEALAIIEEKAALTAAMAAEGEAAEETAG